MKQKTISQLKKELDTVFSKYIRLKNADSNGMVKCFTCGKSFKWQQIQNGHFFTRKSSALRYHEKNCHPQCVNCNMWKKGNLNMYAAQLVETYGGEIITELKALYKTVKKWTHIELEEMIQKYKQRLKEDNNG